MESRLDLFVGIDGGGTGTSTAIIDSDGRVISEGSGGPCNIAVQTDFDIVQSLTDSTHSASTPLLISQPDLQFECACAGIAGYSANERRFQFEAIFRSTIKARRYRVEPDYVIAYWGATHGEPGIVIVAGTGAVAYGRDAAGRTFRSDGLGYLLGDRGSGFDLGISCLRHAALQIESSTKDAITLAVQDFTHAANQSDLVQWLYGGFTTARVASIAPVVGSLAEAGDIDARRLVATVASRLRQTVDDVRRELNMPQETPIYPLGGLWKLGSYLRTEFEYPDFSQGVFGADIVQRDAIGRMHVVPARSSAVYGAALLAMQP